MQLSNRTFPHSLQAEQGVLGGLLIDNQAWNKIEGLLEFNDFFTDEHQKILAL